MGLEHEPFFLISERAW